MAALIKSIPSWTAAMLVAASSYVALPSVAKAAETSAAPKSPRIGLALSGGGARGMAHIGVLKVLEELRVPVHCIAGTSIGSIVGGTYAAGTDAAQMEKIVSTTNWNKIFTDRPPREEISIRRKADDYKTLFAPEFGINENGLVLPKGILAGVSIEAFLRTLAEPAVGIRNFERLPIPFRAVAADIETGEAVVLDHGSVAQAMRASMAIPALVAPVEIDGRLLVDGGIANNLPIDVARQACADVVIAVNIGTPPLKGKEINSALSVAMQLINFLGKQTVDQQLKSLGSRDVLIAPDLGDISAGSFERSADAIRIGEQAARTMADSLKRYSLPPEQYVALRAKQVAPRKSLGTVSEIRFEGLKRTNPEVLRSLVESKPGEPLTEEKISADLQRIYGRGDFESVDYHITESPGEPVLVIRPREKDWGPDYLRFGLGLASDFRGENPFNVLVSYRNTWLNKLGAEWLTEAQVGRDTHLFTEFYQPIEERGRFFVAPSAYVGQTTRGLFFDEQRIAEYDIEQARLGLDFGTTLGTAGEFRLGVQWERVNAEVDTGSPALPGLRQTNAGPRARIFIDQMNSAWFPHRGFRAVASAYWADEGFGSDVNYQRLEGEVSGAASWGPHTLNLALLGGTDLNSDMPAYETFTLGGPLRLSAYRINEFSGQRLSFGRLMYYNRTLPLPDILGAGLYVGASAEVGQLSGLDAGFGTPGTVWSGSVFLGADTFIGPAYLGLGIGESGRYSVYFLLGAP